MVMTSIDLYQTVRRFIVIGMNAWRVKVDLARIEITSENNDISSETWTESREIPCRIMYNT